MQSLTWQTPTVLNSFPLCLSYSFPPLSLSLSFSLTLLFLFPSQATYLTHLSSQNHSRSVSSFSYFLYVIFWCLSVSLGMEQHPLLSPHSLSLCSYSTFYSFSLTDFRTSIPPSLSLSLSTSLSFSFILVRLESKASFFLLPLSHSSSWPIVMTRMDGFPQKPILLLHSFGSSIENLGWVIQSFLLSLFECVTGSVKASFGS